MTLREFKLSLFILEEQKYQYIHNAPSKDKENTNTTLDKI